GASSGSRGTSCPGCRTSTGSGWWSTRTPPPGCPRSWRGATTSAGSRRARSIGLTGSRSRTRITTRLDQREYGAFIASCYLGKFESMTYQSHVDDPLVTDLLVRQRRLFDV